MITDDLSPAIQPYWEVRRTMAGLMYDIDMLIFDHLLSAQDGHVSGDLLEVGAYLGKSAIAIGLHAQPDERVWICDVFEDHSGDDDANVKENLVSYPGLTRATFESNYARFVDTSPVVIQELSHNIRKHVSDRSVRFAHIDGGHLYSTVQLDLENALQYLTPDGLLAMDDVRSAHTPGVAAATWERVAAGDLYPICATEIKLYLSPSRDVADAAVADLLRWFRNHPEIHHGVQQIRERSVAVVMDPRIPTWRTHVRSIIPPIVMNRLRRAERTHLGD